MVKDYKILVTNRLAGWTVFQVWSTIHMCPNWRLLWIDTRILAVGFYIAGIIVGKVKKIIRMLFMNEWK